MGIIAIGLALASVIMPYFAAVFLVPATLVCGVIAYRRGQRWQGVVGLTLAVIGLVGIVAVSQQITSAQQDLEKSLQDLQQQLNSIR